MKFGVWDLGSLRYGEALYDVLYICMFHGVEWLLGEKRIVLWEDMVWNFVHSA